MVGAELDKPVSSSPAPDVARIESFVEVASTRGMPKRLLLHGLRTVGGQAGVVVAQSEGVVNGVLRGVLLQELRCFR